MKIYNEIVIDMNPESSSYRETLHEDSFEYTGDLMLMQNVGDLMTVEEGSKFSGELKRVGGTQVKVFTNKMKYDRKLDPMWSASGVAQWEAVGVPKETYQEFKYTEGGTWEATGGYSTTSPTYDSPEALKETTGSFTYTEEDGVLEFDPTSEEFKTSLEETGGYGELAAGYGVEGTDFDEFYDAPLVAMEAEYGAGGTLEQGRGLDLLSIAETLRHEEAGYDIQETQATEAERAGTTALNIQGAQATEAERAGTVALNLQQQQAQEGLRAGMESYDIAGEGATEGMRSAQAGYTLGGKSAGLQAGRGVADIFAQTSAQQERGGFGAGGAASATARRAQRGVMADYNLQQSQLAEGMTQARSAFDLSQREIASGQTGVMSDFMTTSAGIHSQRGGVQSAYDLAQQGIASDRLGVQSAYDTAQAGIATGRENVGTTAGLATIGVALEGQQAGIDWTRQQADFWKSTEDEFYEDLTAIPT